MFVQQVRHLLLKAGILTRDPLGCAEEGGGLVIAFLGRNSAGTREKIDRELLVLVRCQRKGC